MKTVIAELERFKRSYKNDISDFQERYPDYEVGSGVDSRIKNWTRYGRYYSLLAEVAKKYEKIGPTTFVFILQVEFEKLKHGSTHFTALHVLFKESEVIQDFTLAELQYASRNRFRKGEFKETSKELSRIALLINKMVGGGPEQCREEVTGMSTNGQNKNMSNSGFGGGTIARLAAA